jgi:hypothetical protein
MPNALLIRSLFVVLTLTLPRPAFAQTTSAMREKSRQPKVENATWTEQLETYYGISRSDFASMGLTKLTQDEYIKLFTWVYQRASQAKEEGKAEGVAEITRTQTTYSCGPKIADSGGASTVKLIIDASEENAPEIMSGVRQRLRAISDVQIVYDKKDADLVVAILGFRSTVGSDQRVVGYAASVTTASPCTSKLGTDEWGIQLERNHILNSSGTDVRVLIEDIVTTLDSKDIEAIRQQHAALKRYLSEQKK